MNHIKNLYLKKHQKTKGKKRRTQITNLKIYEFYVGLIFEEPV